MSDCAQNSKEGLQDSMAVDGLMQSGQWFNLREMKRIQLCIKLSLSAEGDQHTTEKKSCAASTLYVKPQILFNNILEATLQKRPKERRLEDGLADLLRIYHRQKVYSSYKIIIQLNRRPTVQTHGSCQLMMKASMA